METLLSRSGDLDAAIVGILEDSRTYSLDQPERFDAAAGIASAALEHGGSLRALVALGQVSSAVCLMRPQFEAVTRSAWLMWAAKDSDVERLGAPLTLESEKAASRLPMLSKMLDDLTNHAPPPATEMLMQFKTTSLASLNSFVHGGIHVLARQRVGYPELLVEQVVRNSNGLQTMAGMLLAILTEDQRVVSRMAAIQPAFADCLPELLQRTC